MENEHTKHTEDHRRRSVVFSAAWNYAGYAYQIVLNFGLTAYIVRHISVAEYGLYFLVMSISATLNLLDLGISGVLVQRYVHSLKASDGEPLDDLLATAFVALGVLGMAGVGILCGLAWALPGPFRIPRPLLHQAAIVFVIAGLIMQVRLPAAALRQVFEAYERFDRINQFSLITGTFQAVLSVCALIAGYGITGLCMAQIAGALLQFLILIVALPHAAPGIRLRVFRFRGRLLRALVADGKWAFLTNVTSYLVEIATWGILGSLGSMTEIALYGIAAKAPYQLWNLADRGADVLLPVLSGYSAEGDHANLRRVFLSTQQLIFGASLPFVILGAVFASPILRLWAGAQYVNAAIAMRWLLVAVMAHAIAYSSDLMLFACGQFKRAAWIYGVGASGTCLGAVLLVPRYGAAGMAASLALSLTVIDCGWFTMEACRISRMSVQSLLHSLVRGLGWPVLALAAAIFGILSLQSALSPLWTVIAAAAGGAVYFALWGYRTALPLYRNRAEMVQ